MFRSLPPRWQCSLSFPEGFTGVSLHGGYLLLRTKAKPFERAPIGGDSLKSRGRPALQHAGELRWSSPVPSLFTTVSSFSGGGINQRWMVLFKWPWRLSDSVFLSFPTPPPHLTPHCLPTLCPLSVCSLFIDSPLNSV